MNPEKRYRQIQEERKQALSNLKVEDVFTHETLIQTNLQDIDVIEKMRFQETLFYKLSH